jgi:hypothetical protein
VPLLVNVSVGEEPLLLLGEPQLGGQAAEIQQLRHPTLGLAKPLGLTFDEVWRLQRRRG